MRALSACRELMLSTLALEFKDARLELADACMGKGIGLYQVAILRCMLAAIWVSTSYVHCSKWLTIWSTWNADALGSAPPLDNRDDSRRVSGGMAGAMNTPRRTNNHARRVYHVI